MEKLNTKRLLAYKNRLLRVGDGYCEKCGDCCEYVIKELLEQGVLIKSSPIWQETYKAVKEVLATREHIERAE